MTKTQEIEDLKKVLAEERAEHKRVWELWNEACARETARNLAAADAEVDAERAAAKEVENATVRQVEAGLIPVDALRKLVSSDYSVTHMRDRMTIETTLLFRSNDPVDEAIYKAIFRLSTANSKPRYADGGYASHVVELSPVDRQLLKDIRDGAK